MKFRRPFAIVLTLITCSSLWANRTRAEEIFATDSLNGSIYAINSATGNIDSTYSSGLSAPGGLAFNNQGDLFVANSGSNSVLEFSVNNNAITQINSFTNSSLSGPNDIAFDSKGNMYVTNYSTGTVSEYNFTSASWSTFASGLSTPTSLAVDSNGNVFVAASPLTGNNSLFGFNSSGSALSGFPTSLPFSGSPFGLATGANNTIFMSDNVNLAIDSLSSPSSTVSNAFSLSSTALTPFGLAYSGASSNLYVAEGTQIEAYNTSGTLLNTYSNASFGNVQYLAVEPLTKTVPEPSSIVLLAIGAGGLCKVVRKRTKSASA